jgi:hypothetical protein
MRSGIIESELRHMDRGLRTQAQVAQAERIRPKAWSRGGAIATAWLLSTLTTGCTLLLDTDKKQCSTDKDCTQLFGSTAPYLCTNQVCERPSCESDQECKDRGGAFATSICSESERLCAPAECVDNAQCGVGQTCDTSTNRCAKRECDTTEDCRRAQPSPTVECIQGFCVDPTWSCIGRPDDRAREPGATGTLRVPLYSSTDGKPVPGAQWTAKVCAPAQLDQACERPLAVDEPEYDADTGIMTISGLSYDTPVRIQFDEVALSDSVIPMDFYTQRPAVGVTEVPPVRVVTRAGLAALIASFAGVVAGAEQPVNPALGNIYGLLFDCEGKPAGDVQLSYTNPLGEPFSPAPVVLYFDEQQVPSLVRQWSYPTGVFSSLNIPLENINVGTTLIVDSSSNPVKTRSIRSEYKLRLAPSRMTTVHFYPRDYSK